MKYSVQTVPFSDKERGRERENVGGKEGGRKGKRKKRWEERRQNSVSLNKANMQTVYVTLNNSNL